MTNDPVKVQKISSVRLNVADLNRSLAFYTQALGFEPIADLTVGKEHDRLRTATLALGDERIRLVQYLDRSGTEIPTDSRSNDCWFQHLAIVVSDMARAYQQLCEFSIVAISTAPQTIPIENHAAAGIQAFKFTDPDRHPLELLCFPPAQGPAKWQQTDRLFLGIDHTAIVVANTAQSLEFYQEQLGMQIDGGSFNWRETQARMDDLPEARVWITALRPSQGGMGIELLDYVSPLDGRPFPADLQSEDLAHVTVELTIAATDRAVKRQTRRDPTGHYIELITESRA